jgi:3',5'-cyclic AMP phosphodiesterase CpdA
LYKIAHISDIHINTFTKNNHLQIFENLLKDIRKRKCDHLIITGDISNNALKEEYNIIINLLDKYKFNSSSSLTVCIGNHDIFGGTTKSGNSFFYPYLCKKINYSSKLNLFEKYFCDYDEKYFKDKNIFKYPKIKIISGNLAAVIVNSIPKWSLQKNPGASNGYIYSDNLNKIKDCFKSELLKNKYVMVIIHHHFNTPNIDKDNLIHSLWLFSEKDTMKLHNGNDLLKLFYRYNVKYILHGHTHITNSYKIKNTVFLNSSGCVMPFTEDGKYKYHILNVEYPDSFKKLKTGIQIVTMK